MMVSTHIFALMLGFCAVDSPMVLVVDRNVCKDLL